MTFGLLNTTGFQNLKYKDQGIFRTFTSTFVSHSSRILRVWHQATR